MPERPTWAQHILTCINSMFIPQCHMSLESLMSFVITLKKCILHYMYLANFLGQKTLYSYLFSSAVQQLVRSASHGGHADLQLVCTTNCFVQSPLCLSWPLLLTLGIQTQLRAVSCCKHPPLTYSPPPYFLVSRTCIPTPIEKKNGSVQSQL